MPLGSLSSVLEVKQAEGFRGATVLAPSLPVGGPSSAGAAPAPVVDGVLLTSVGDYFVNSAGDYIAFV